MSSDTPIKIEKLSKHYQIYDKPRDRLKQIILPRLQRLAGIPVKKYYRDFVALRDISFEVKSGESVGIIGHNGSGKSTLLQLICGTLYQTSGAIQTSGRIAALLELGSGFNPEFTGRENIYMNAAILGLSKEEINQRFNNIVAFADIGDFLDQPVKTYSSGMAVRLAFAVQAHVSPEILVIDEALAVGDVFFQQKCVRYMRDSLSECTKVLVTHDMQAVHSFCSRVLVLKNGELIYDGSVREGIECYMRSVHSSAFKEEGGGYVDEIKNGGELSLGVSEGNGPERRYLKTIEKDVIGGAERVVITGVFVSINANEILDERSIVFAGDEVEVGFVVKADLKFDNLIFGYLLVDKNGMYVCGDNSFSLGKLYSVFPDRDYVCRIKFRWPPIANGSYTLTLGVGSGQDSHNHTIECWAHSIFLFESMSVDVVHGIFTNSLAEISLALDGHGAARG